MNKIIIVGTIIIFSAGIIVGLKVSDFYQRYNTEKRIAVYSKEKFTNPLLECEESPQEILIGTRAQIEKSVTSYVDESLQKGNAKNVSVYFRDLNNGPWFGIREREPYSPGSLLKLPIAISYYWEAEYDPEILDKQIYFRGDLTEESNESDSLGQKKIVNGKYSVKDLIGSMLKESSNDAASTLVNNIDEECLKKTYQDLGIMYPERNNGEYTIDVKTFGAFFRVLYNASYIAEVASEEILSTLADSSFTNGLVAGVPKSVPVAHKFGTRIVEKNGEQYRQLHDCGIVYAPKTPYILCVMSQGKNVSELESLIAHISRLVYEGVENKK